MTPGTVQIRLFASAREVVGRPTIEMAVPEKGVRARRLVEQLRAEHPGLGPLLRTCRFVRNGSYLASLAAVLRPGDELSIHPPYGGG